MKYSKKQTSPTEFENWKANECPQNLNYGNLRGDPKTSLEKSLLNEQGYVCCYCGRSVNDAGDKDYHVEHYLDQSTHSTHDLEYENLFISCQRNMKRGDPLMCGNRKGNWHIPHPTLKPSNPSSEKRFAYSIKGAISGYDSAATEVIRKLALDCATYTEMRGRLIRDSELAIIQGNIDKQTEIDRLRARNSANCLQSFGHAVAIYLESQP